jgi:hypothetical protein
MEALGVERLVHEQLHHHQLVDRRQRDALEQRLEAGVDLGRRGRVDRESPPVGLRARR